MHSVLERHAEAIHRVFGDEIIPVLKRLEVHADADKNSCQVWEDGSIKFFLKSAEADNPFIVVHELAHGMHSYYFPDLTEVTPVERAEACAYLAELQLRRQCPQAISVSLSERRAAEWSYFTSQHPVLSKARDIMVRAAVPSGDGPPWKRMNLKSIFQLILWGEFDGAAKPEDTCKGAA